MRGHWIIIFSQQTMQAYNLGQEWTEDGCIHCCRQPRIFLGASGTRLTSDY